MINDIHVKICGLTSAADASAAARAGADFLGFILWPKSPRAVSLEKFSDLQKHLPPPPAKVAVMVEPDGVELARALSGGFDFAQVHFRHSLPLGRVREWSRIAGAKRLWLAPKLPPEIDVAPEWLSLADAFLLDTFRADADGFGGSGATGDWGKFARHRSAHGDKLWILAGGLTPDNAAGAVEASGARFLDVNSGVESAPGVKDHAKLDALARALRQR